MNFKKGNNQNLSVDIKPNKFLNLFEDFSAQKDSQSDLSRERTTFQQIHENIPLANQAKRETFRVQSKMKMVKSSIAFEKPIFKKQKNVQLLQPLYESNSLLLLKLKKLPKYSLPKRMVELIKESKVQKKELEGLKLNFRRLAEFSFDENEYCTLQQYFQMNYPKQTEDDKFDSWLMDQYELVKWKQLGLCKLYEKHKDNSLLMRANKKNLISTLINELEYRFYISFILQQRTIISKIKSKDENMNQHLVLMIQDIISQNDRKLIKLSDGWDSVTMVLTHQSPLFNKNIKQSDKSQIHIMNMSFYPIKIRGIDDFLVQIPFNSMKRARDNAKLGQQKLPYFLRTISSISRLGQLIPALDVFVMNKSYCFRGNGQQKQCVKITEEDELNSEVYQNSKKYSFSLYILDSIHYFEKSEVESSSLIQLDVLYATQVLYNNINVGDRVMIFNSYPQGQILEVKQSKSGGVCNNQDMLVQHSNYAQEKIEECLVMIESIPLEGIDKALKIVIWIQNIHNYSINGVTQNNESIVLKLHSIKLLLNKEQLVGQIVLVSHIYLIEECLVTCDLTKVEILSQYCQQKYKPGFDKLYKLFFQ